MKQYEITFIIDPVLPGDEIQKAATAYEKLLKDESCTIVNIDDIGLKQLAYPINKRNSGVYKCIEFQTETGAPISKVELAMRRDERIMRFLTISLDKYGIKYNDDKRKGLIGSKKSNKEDKEVAEETVVKDDLTLIEGIDYKAGKLLKTSGVKTYAQLADSKIEDVKNILAKGGTNYASIDPSTWATQASLAAAGKWAELNDMKFKLVNGESSEEE
jgi:small subunit ribosomal protein S6